MLIVTSGRRSQSDTEARMEMDAANEAGNAITDGTARAIAAWYMSPGYPWVPFAALASTGRVESSDLMHAIEMQAACCTDPGASEDCLRDMFALYFWVATKINRGEND